MTTIKRKNWVRKTYTTLNVVRLVPGGRPSDALPVNGLLHPGLWLLNGMEKQTGWYLTSPTTNKDILFQRFVVSIVSNV
jgi:hypothetical protein